MLAKIGVQSVIFALQVRGQERTALAPSGYDMHQTLFHMTLSNFNIRRREGVKNAENTQKRSNLLEISCLLHVLTLES